MSQPRILIAEPALPIANALRKFLEGWAEVQLVKYVDEAVQALRARPVDVVVAAVSATFDGDVLVPMVRKQSPETAVVLLYPGNEAEGAPERSRAAGADGFLVLPPKKHHVMAVLQAVARLNGLAQQLRALEASFKQYKAQRQRPSVVRSMVGLNAPDEAFFKRYMLMEVKRSKRYQYPVAVLVVGLDNLKDALGEAAPEFQRAAIRAEAIENLSTLLRDIDVAMPFGEDKYLLFLPFTPLKGCGVVAGRVVERLSKLDSFPQGTASVGVASFDPKVTPRSQVSFGGLVREATLALKKAQDAGGNQYLAPAAPSASTPKRSRISMG